MKFTNFPDTIFVTREGEDEDESYYLVNESWEDETEDESVVAVYELREIFRHKTKHSKGDP